MQHAPPSPLETAEVETEVIERQRRRAALTAVVILIEKERVTEEELTRLAAPLSGVELLQVRG